MKVKDLIKKLSILDQDMEITTCRAPSTSNDIYKIYPVNERINIDTPDSLGNYSVISTTDSIQNIIESKVTNEHNVIGYIIWIQDTITSSYEVIDKLNIKYDNKHR
jgi:hypothetical protein